MADKLSFLDKNGVRYLWSQLSLEDYPNNEVLVAVINAIDESKADKAEIPEIIKKHFLVVETIKDGSNYLLDGITFDELYDKFQLGNVNMVCHVDGTDYIPLLSVTPNKIMFSGIYQTTSVSLDFDSNGVGTLTSNFLVNQERLHYYSTKTETDTKIADLVNSAPETLDTLGELAAALEENQEVVDILNASIANKQNKNVIVYRDSETKLASMTAPQIMEKVRLGENVYYTPNLQGGTLHPYLEGSDTAVFFYSNYIDNSRVIGTGVLIDANGTISTETFKLAHLTDKTIHITDAERNRWNDTYTKTETDSLVEAKVNALTESNVFIVDCSGESEISHTFEQIMEAVNQGKAVYALLYGTVYVPLVYIAEDGSYIEFNNINSEVNEDQQSYAWSEGLRVYNDNTFITKSLDLLTLVHNDIQTQDGEKNIVTVINRLIEKSEDTYTKAEADNLFSSPTEYDAIILKSSTEGSSKKFRLTIDDDGVLSAEEVIE